MLCRYLALQLLIGAAVALALAELAWPDARVSPVKGSKLAPENFKSHVRRPLDSVIRPPDGLPEIPPMYRRLPAVAEAERVVRSRR